MSPAEASAMPQGRYARGGRNTSMLCRWSLFALLLLAAPATAQPHLTECPDWPQPPEFVARVVTELDQLQPHEQRWQSPVHWQQLLRELARFREDGLNPGYYHLPEIALIGGRQSEDRLPDRCHAGLASLMLAWAVKDLSFGRLDPEALGLVWHRQHRRPEAHTFARRLHRAFQSQDGLRKAFNEARPSTRAYRNLRKAYGKRLATLAVQWPTISAGGTLRPGDRNERVNELSRRLIAQGYLPGNAPWPGGPGADTTTAGHFHEAMAAAVADFQRDHGLTPDGLVGKNTRAALNLPPAAWTARVRANLERIRWFTPYQQPDQLVVDIAGARVSLFRAAEVVWNGRAQVGRAERKTPALTSTISHVTVNPTWTIPPTIFYEDTLPAIQADPDYLYRNRLTVLDRTGTPLDPEQVDWSRPGNLLLRQAAGAGNALGEVVIRFPNPFAVYLHDTPSQRLFGTPERFYSSGCVRVENAISLTDELFHQGSDGLLWQLEQARRSGDTRNVSLPRGIPLIMAYWTAEADESGRIRFRQDTYEEDEQVIDLLEAEDQVIP
ncbi:murein L,D-transpeptidase [Marinobacter sp.]|uniref:L,D-transpeptidase family protein n=1 Tax=Marinobacter sp. TaxID=50741 RepID=UPI0035686880